MSDLFHASLVLHKTPIILLLKRGSFFRVSGSLLWYLFLQIYNSIYQKKHSKTLIVSTLSQFLLRIFLNFIKTKQIRKVELNEIEKLKVADTESL